MLNKIGEDFTQAVQEQKNAAASQQSIISKNLNSTKGWTPSVSFINDQLNSLKKHSSSPYRAKSNLSAALPGNALIDSIKKQKRELQKLQKEKKHFRNLSNDYGKAVDIKK